MAEPVNPRAAVELLHVLLAAASSALAPEPPAAPPPVEYLSPTDFAARLGIAVSTVRDMCAAGMPHVRPRPRLIRINVALAEAWMAKRPGTQRSATPVEAAKRATVDARRGEMH